MGQVENAPTYETQPDFPPQRFVMSVLLRAGMIAGWLLFAVPFAIAEDVPRESFSPEQLDFFEAQVRPLLARHCYECHSAKAKAPKGHLRLDNRALAIKGGESGAALVPHKPEESLLIAAVRWKALEMPPQGKLKESEVLALVKWIEMGAPWPSGAEPKQLASKAGEYDWPKWRREHWAFQPVVKPSPPVVRDESWLQNPLDRFVLAQLEQENLKPSPPADARVLVRRIYLDLIGWPPTPQQADAFVAAAQRDRATALLTLVDELLASPHYGERWGRHWLDVARYSDGYGGFLDNVAYNDAWRYRDWVVESLNQDRPFEQFLRLQIAGDFAENKRDAIATGFFALGPTYISDGGDPDSIAQARAETLSDRIDTLGQAMLGLTIACARCHDHKFDPIPQQDYYSLAGVFNNTATHEHPLVSDDVVQAFHQQQQAIADLNKKMGDLKGQISSAKREATETEQRELNEFQAKLADLQKSALPKYPIAHTLSDIGSADLPVAIRGNLRNAGELAPRRFPRILAGDNAPLFREGSGRRQLAEAVADPSNPLTGRVFVNRVWMHHFGQALVRTPNNFGALGESPTHPQLLDWLTAKLIESQSIKTLHRTILLSSTYQMTSDFNEQAFAKDGDNRLLWRMNPRRLEVEAWRDSLLSVTGELDRTLGGPPMENLESRRRTLYFKVSRNGDVFATDEFLRLFDFPLMRASVAKRPTSIVPQQFLFFLNSPWMVQRSKAFAKRLADEANTDDQRIQLAYQLLYQRAPSDAELKVGLDFLQKSLVRGQELSSWDQYAQVLLSSNEFMYVR